MRNLNFDDNRGETADLPRSVVQTGGEVVSGPVPNAPYVIFALPRSRTAWLSHFLSYGDWACGHDELRHMRSLSDVRAWFSQPCTGSVETAGAPFWRLLEGNVRVVVIRRPVAEVVESLMNIPGCAFDRATITAAMTRLDAKLAQIEARVPGVLSVKFADLADESTCARIFEHCLPYQHDSERWRALSAVNIQIDMRALIRYCQAFAPALDKLASVAKHKILSGFAVREPVSPDGITIQTEDFATWLRDARPLIDRHLVLVGEAPGDWQGKNLPLMQTLYDAGAMQITTARSNGRMFGYRMTLIGPSLTSENVVTGTNTTVYADPSFPGLGAKLERASLRFLKDRGVTEVFYEAGKRGSGDRICAMFKRLGAVDHGQVYRLQLAEV